MIITALGIDVSNVNVSYNEIAELKKAEDALERFYNSNCSAKANSDNRIWRRRIKIMYIKWKLYKIIIVWIYLKELREYSVNGLFALNKDVFFA